METAEWLTRHLLGLDPATRLGGSVAFFLYDSVKILLLLAVMMFVVGVLRTFLPMKKMRGWMSGRRIWSYLGAALFGAVTPFCSCSSIPLFFGFLRAGIPLGVCLAFMVTSPVLNEYLFVLMAAEFGLGIAALYAIAGIVAGVSAGFLIGKSSLARQVEPDFDAEAPEDDASTCRGWKERAVFGVKESISILKSIWHWVLVGVAVGAFLHNYVPTEMIDNIVGKTGVFAVPLATILGVPLYGNCAAIVPIAVVLFEKGIPLGTALCFLMAVSALSLPEAILLRRALKLPLILAFFGVTAGAIMIIGTLLNLIAS